MKKLLVSALLLATSYETIAQTANLKVTGAFGAQGVCNITSTNFGTYDFGVVSSALVKPAARTPLSPISATWTVECSTTTSVTFSTSDSQRASLVEPATLTNFGLGNVNNTGKIGHYTVTAIQPTVDGREARVFTIVGTGAIDGKPSATLGHTQRTGWAQTVDPKLLSVGKVFKVNLDVTPTLNSETEMSGPPQDGTQLNGGLTLTFKQGL